MINVRDGLVRNRLELFQRRCVSAAALESEPRPRQRRSQIVGDVVADARERVDHRFHFIKHAIDDGREPRNASSTSRCGSRSRRLPAMIR